MKLIIKLTIFFLFNKLAHCYGFIKIEFTHESYLLALELQKSTSRNFKLPTELIELKESEGLKCRNKELYGPEMMNVCIEKGEVFTQVRKGPLNKAIQIFFKEGEI